MTNNINAIKEKVHAIGIKEKDSNAVSGVYPNSKNTYNLAQYVQGRLDREREREVSFHPLTSAEWELDQRYGRMKTIVTGAIDDLVAALYYEAPAEKLEEAKAAFRKAFSRCGIFMGPGNIFESKPDQAKISSVIEDIEALVKKEMGKGKSAAGAEAVGEEGFAGRVTKSRGSKAEIG